MLTAAAEAADMVSPAAVAPLPSASSPCLWDDAQPPVSGSAFAVAATAPPSQPASPRHPAVHQDSMRTTDPTFLYSSAPQLPMSGPSFMKLFRGVAFSSEDNAEPRTPTGTRYTRMASKAGKRNSLEQELSIWDVAKRQDSGALMDETVATASLADRGRSCWESSMQDLKTLRATIRKTPAVVVIPVVLLLLCLGLGLWAVFASSAQETQQRRDRALQVASDKALYLKTELEKVFLPAKVTDIYIRRERNWTDVYGSFSPLALELIGLSRAGSIRTISLVPNGVIYTMAPLIGSSPAQDSNWRAIGKDWLQDAFNWGKVLTALETKDLTIIGPYNLTQGGIGMVVMLSVNMAGASATDTLGVPNYRSVAPSYAGANVRDQTAPNTTGTPFEKYMYNETGGYKWWGLTTVLISWDTLRDDVMRLGDLVDKGYSYVLSRPADQNELQRARPDLANASHELAVAWSDSVQQVPLNATNNNSPPRQPGQARPLVYYDLHEKLDDPVNSTLSIYNTELHLYVQFNGGWVPSWRGPMIAVVVVLSVLSALLLFVALVNRYEHLHLLHAMIPAKVINTVRRGKVFTEQFSSVTVLFSDIVSYTTMASGMQPMEVVQLLNELYTHYDALTEKFQLYKVETIGDAFVCVGGAPSKEDPVAAAARVVQMGLAMVDLTSRLELMGGRRVRIRVGIHSGPCVAAVVGRMMPRYCLFGDTINTTSRMESNSLPMQVHISGATADLLKHTDGFRVEPRGDIVVKGKGIMSTFWVWGCSSSTSPLSARRESLDISGLAPDASTHPSTANLSPIIASQPTGAQDLEADAGAAKHAMQASPSMPLANAQGAV